MRIRDDEMLKIFESRELSVDEKAFKQLKETSIALVKAYEKVYKEQKVQSEIEISQLKAERARYQEICAILKREYEQRLNADIVAKLEEIQQDIEEITISEATVPNEIFWNMGANAMKKEIGTRVQEKIDKLKDNKIEGPKDRATLTDTTPNFLELTTKNDLDVDCISRKQAIKTIQRYGVGCFDTDEFSPEECERFVIAKLNTLSPVTPRPRKGHWIKEYTGEGEVRHTCSCCGKDQFFRTDFCYHCGSDNREVEE